jgi:hypothetical protein
MDTAADEVSATNREVGTLDISIEGVQYLSQ